MLSKEETNRPWHPESVETSLLDLGCGGGKRAGAIGMDKQAREGVDIVHDLETIPWPIDDDKFHAIIAWHVFEHVKPWLMIDIMNECWRVAKVDGLLYVGMPMAGSVEFYQDPTHVHTWNSGTPKHFDPRSAKHSFYQSKPWKVEVNTTYTLKTPKQKTALYFVFRKEI